MANEKTDNDNYPIYRGKRHSEGGIPAIVDGVTPVEIEKGEVKICVEKFESKEVLTYKDKTNLQILNDIHDESSCKFDKNVADSGDFILCRFVVNDPERHDRKGTVKEILNQMQSENSCRVSHGANAMKDGGIVTMDDKLDMVSRIKLTIGMATLMDIGYHEPAWGEEDGKIYLRFKASGANYKKGLYIYVYYKPGKDLYDVKGIVSYNYKVRDIATYEDVYASDLAKNIKLITDGKENAKKEDGGEITNANAIAFIRMTLKNISGAKSLSKIDEISNSVAKSKDYQGLPEQLKAQIQKTIANKKEIISERETVVELSNDEKLAILSAIKDSPKKFDYSGNYDKLKSLQKDGYLRKSRGVEVQSSFTHPFLLSDRGKQFIAKNKLGDGVNNALADRIEAYGGEIELKFHDADMEIKRDNCNLPLKWIDITPTHREYYYKKEKIATNKDGVIILPGDEPEIKEDGGDVGTPVKAYLMMNEQYLKEVVPLLKEYKKFLKKNDKYFSYIGYSGFRAITFKEAKEASDKKEKLDYTWDFSEYESYESPEEKLNGLFIGKDKDCPQDIIEKKNEYLKKIIDLFSDEMVFKHSALRESDALKSNKRIVRYCIDYGVYEKLLKDGEVEIEQLEKIAESGGVRIPKRLYDFGTGKAISLSRKYDEMYAKVPPINRAVLKQLVEDIEKSFEPYSEKIRQQEQERYEKLINKFLQQKEIDQYVIYQQITFYKDILSFTKTEERYEYEEDKYGKHKVTHTYLLGASLKPEWKTVLQKVVHEFVEQLKLQLFHSILENFQRITSPIQSFEKIKMGLGAKGFQGSFKFNFEHGSFVFSTEAIAAGGYNIQCFHFRYIRNFSDVIVNGQPVKTTSLLDIIKYFSTREELEKSTNPIGSIENANRIEDIINIMYKYLKEGNVRMVNNIRKYATSISYSRDGWSKGMYFDGVDLPAAKERAKKILIESLGFKTDKLATGEIMPDANADDFHESGGSIHETPKEIVNKLLNHKPAAPTSVTEDIADLACKFFLKLKTGDSFKLGSITYTVTRGWEKSNTQDDAKNVEYNLRLNVRAVNKKLYFKYGTLFGVKGRQVDWFDQIYRDAEGKLLVDSINALNPFHEKSEVWEMAHREYPAIFNTKFEDGGEIDAATHRIGFANKYYTLWILSKDPVYFTDSHGSHHFVRDKYNYYYIKNISFSLDEVKKQYPNVPIDEELRGKTRSFSWTNQEEDKCPEILKFGKYSGRNISEVAEMDFGYILWLLENANNAATRNACAAFSEARMPSCSVCVRYVYNGKFVHFFLCFFRCFSASSESGSTLNDASGNSPKSTPLVSVNFRRKNLSTAS